MLHQIVPVLLLLLVVVGLQVQLLKDGGVLCQDGGVMLLDGAEPPIFLLVVHLSLVVARSSIGCTTFLHVGVPPR